MFTALLMTCLAIGPGQYQETVDLPRPMLASSQLNETLGAVLVNVPPGTPVPEVPESQWAVVTQSILIYMVRNEFLDHREMSHYFYSKKDFASDLDVMRRRREEFKDAPPLSDAIMLPPRNYAIELIQMNRSFAKHVEALSNWELDRSEFYNEVLSETNKLYKPWDYVRDAGCEFYYVTVRRDALRKLKTFLGEEAYAAKKMPHYLPLHRFNERQ
mgnify:CR=1 FL=1